MSDDVKVKFSGDFSDVAKGASEAAKTAGTAISGQFQSLATNVTSALGGMFAATALFDKFKEGIAGAKEYFSELNKAIRTTAGGGEEFQRVAGLARSVGVSMDAVARSVGLFSKYIGQASKDVNGHGKVLKELGFTDEQIASGNITATQALAALGKQLQNTGNEALVAANATTIFGRSGRELLPIIAKGESAITEQSSALKIYSDAELQAAAAAERAAERRTAAWKKFFKFIEVAVDEQETKLIVGASIQDVAERLQSKGIDIRSGAGREEYQKELIKDLSSKGVGLAAQQAGTRAYMQQQLATPGLDAAARAGIASELSGLISAMAKAELEAKQKKPEEAAASSESSAALAASTLQAIGGGDITSVLAGTSPMDMTAENTRQANIYLKTIAEKKPVEQVDGTAAH